MLPKVSVIITAYQKAQFLPRALQSVLDQTFQDFELIVVDDGSTDATREIVERFVQRDRRIKYIYQENQGPGSARNTGIQAAQADLVALLDGDDEWFPEKLEHQVQIMTSYPIVDLILTNMQYVNTIDKGRIVNPSSHYHDYVLTSFTLQPLSKNGKVYLIKDKDFPAKIALKNVFLPTSVMFRKWVWDKVGGFNEELRGPEDLDFWVRAALKKCQFAYTSHIGAIYYKNETSLVQASEKTYLEQLKHALYAYSSPEYEPIHEATQSLVHKRFRQLVVFYTYQRQPGKAWQAFRQSMSYGIDLRTLLMAIASPIGPGLFTAYRRFRKLTIQWIKVNS